MINDLLQDVEELLEVMHDEVGPSNLDEYFDDDGNHIDGDERAYMYTYLVCDSCGAMYKIKEYFEITERTVEEEE